VTESADGAIRPTRENLAKAFEAARAASPDDLLVVYLSGHGVNYGGQDGDFCYLRGEEEVATFAVERPVADMPALAARIVEEARSRIP
jgi:hypothetical protein